MISKRKYSVITVLTICFTILMSGCNNDLCSNVTCPDICHGNELWSQACKDGNCIDYKRVTDCSSYCGCIPNKSTTVTTTTTDGRCSNIYCDSICVGNELWSSKCVNGECIKDKLLQKCSDECGCEPYIFSEIPKGITYISSWGLSEVYNFKEGDIIRVITTCRKSSCKDGPFAYYIFLGNRGINDLEMGEKFQVVQTPNEWHIEKDGNYLLAITNEYYMTVGYLIEK